jgi:hypothetical protein
VGLVIAARFEGGPFDGLSLAIAGRVPGYLMLMHPPAGVAVNPVVVGADFDDHWPGQQRYEIADELLAEAGEFGYLPTVVYRHVVTG